MAVGADGRTSAVYTAEMMLDGNLETFACLLDETRTGNDPDSRPPNGSLPVTGLVVFDLGAVRQVSGLELVSRLAGTCYLPREVDVVAVAADSVTPDMLAWWYRVLPISQVEFDGAVRPMYHLFHPYEHGRIWVEAPAADGRPGVGAGGIVARYEWFGPYDSTGAAQVVELSPRRFVSRPVLAGVTFGEIRHEWGNRPEGATYTVVSVIGVDWPVIGPWVNALLRRYAFSEGMLREWQRHQVEEVGLLPHFLPLLYARRNDDNVYELD